MYRKFYLTCVEDNSSDEEDEEDEEVIAEDGEVGEHQEKPEDLLDNYYFLPGEDDFEVCLSVAISVQYVVPACRSTYLLTFYVCRSVCGSLPLTICRPVARPKSLPRHFCRCSRK